MPTSPTTQAIELSREGGGVLRTKDALALGIHPRTLYGLRAAGVLDRVSRGIYRLASEPDLAHPDLVTVALRVRARYGRSGHGKHQLKDFRDVWNLSQARAFSGKVLA